MHKGNMGKEKAGAYEDYANTSIIFLENWDVKVKKLSCVESRTF